MDERHKETVHYLMVNTHMKRCSTSLVTTESKLKPQLWRYIYKYIRMGKFFFLKWWWHQCWETGRKVDHSGIARGNVKWYSPWENSLAISYKAKHATTILPNNCTPGHLFKTNEQLGMRRNLLMNVFRSFTHKPKTEYNPDVLH